jgi:hypothetical protein
VKKLFVVASMAAGLTVGGAVPAFAQSATTNPPGWFASAYNGAASPVQAQNYNQAQGASSNDAHVGDGSRPDYLLHQQELWNMPGYGIPGNG